MRRREDNRSGPHATTAVLLLTGLLLAGFLTGCGLERTAAFPDGSYPEECVTPSAPCPPGTE